MSSPIWPVLAPLIESILEGRPHLAVSCGAMGSSGLSAWLRAVARLVTAGTNEEVSPIAMLVRERGWFVTILIVFLGGLALNLTPCVYPMIAITVSYFGGQGGERNARRAFVSSLIYCLGIVLTYSTLGLIAALTGFEGLRPWDLGVDGLVRQRPHLAFPSAPAPFRCNIG